MASVYAFDYNTWVAAFPEMSEVSKASAENYFNLATLFIRNDGRGPVKDPNMQAGLMNLTTAHLATLLSTKNSDGAPDTSGTEASPLVGRIANASEGSVKLQIDFPDQQPNSAWWNQTKYGAAVWVALRAYRTMRYLPNPHRRVFNPPMRYYGFGTGI